MIFKQFHWKSILTFLAIFICSTFKPMFIHFDIKFKQFELEKSGWWHSTDFLKHFLMVTNFCMIFLTIIRKKININKSLILFSFFAYYLLFVDVNIFTLSALKSRRLELLSSAWRYLKDLFLLFAKVTDFNIVFKVVLSLISHISETIL